MEMIARRAVLAGVAGSAVAVTAAAAQPVGDWRAKAIELWARQKRIRLTPAEWRVVRSAPEKANILARVDTNPRVWVRPAGCALATFEGKPAGVFESCVFTDDTSKRPTDKIEFIEPDPPGGWMYKHVPVRQAA